MFELEALLLGLEPVTALTIGVGALLVAPVVGAIDSMTGGNVSDGARNAAKTGLVWAFEAFDKVQHTVAETSESVQDLIAEAKSEMGESKNGSSEPSPREVTIG
ncbi:hypothetical protein ACQ4M3_28445 [Leptolyngbya sp. AN03gr2]|uniref:hypothetical protein n=1 Tax=unclassified Leptolyngbya TaxID=2650499 RepID=UPI003D31D563